MTSKPRDQQVVGEGSRAELAEIMTVSRDLAPSISGVVRREAAAKGTEPRRTIPTTCIEHQAGRPTLRLSFQIKVF